MSEQHTRLRWPALLALFLVALALRVAFVVDYERSHPLADRPGIDEESYDGWAREIAGGEWLGREIFFQEPLYPYLLGASYALAGETPTEERHAARLLQACVGAATVALGAALAARLFGRFAGWCAGVLLALHGPAIWFTALLLKESLFSLALLGFAALLVATRARDEHGRLRPAALSSWLALGVLGALGALLRGNMLVLLPAFALWPIARALAARRASRAAAVSSVAFVLGACSVLVPVVLRNQHVGGRFVLSTSGAGTNVYGGNNLDNPYGIATEFAWVRGIPEHEAGDWRREASRRAGRELDATETSSFWLRAALASMAEHPLEHARILVRKLRLTLGAYEVPDNHFIEWDARFVPLLALPWPDFAWVGTLGIAGLLVFAVSRRAREAQAQDAAAAGEVALVALSYLGTVVLTVTSERIRLPLVALLAPFAGFALNALRGGAARSVLVVPALALAGALVLMPVMPQDERESDFDERDFNYAVALLSEGDVEAAAPIVDGLVARRAGSARVQVVAAELEYRRARAELDRAQRASRMPERPALWIESALRRLEGAELRGTAQERFRAHVLDGAIRQYLGQWSEAEERYRAALAFDADDRDLRRRLAVCVAERAMLAPDAPTRRARLDDAIAVVEGLLAEAPDPELSALLAQFRARR